MSSWRYTFEQLMQRAFTTPATTDGIKELIEHNVLGIQAGKVALAAVDTVGGVFSFQNPEPVKIDIIEVILDVQTVAAATCTLDVGKTAIAAATADTVMNGINAETIGIHRAEALVTLDAKDGTNDWLTGSKATGATSGLVGFVFIFYKKQAAA